MCRLVHGAMTKSCPPWRRRQCSTSPMTRQNRTPPITTCCHHSKSDNTETAGLERRTVASLPSPSPPHIGRLSLWHCGFSTRIDFWLNRERERERDFVHDLLGRYCIFRRLVISTLSDSQPPSSPTTPAAAAKAAAANQRCRRPRHRGACGLAVADQDETSCDEHAPRLYFYGCAWPEHCRSLERCLCALCRMPGDVQFLGRKAHGPHRDPRPRPDDHTSGL